MNRVRWSVGIGLLMVLLLAFVGGCDKKETAAPETKPDAQAQPADQPAQQGKTEEVAFDEDAKPKTFAGSHILIAYQGAMRANPSVTRTKEEAKKLADELAAQVSKAPATLPDVAKQKSDCPSAPQGGDLGTWMSGMMIPEFQAALEKMEIGAVSPTPVETQFGFHIIRRNTPTPTEEVMAEHIIVMHKDTIRPQEGVTRTKEEAQARAKEAADKAKAAPDTFGEVAKAYSDDPGRNLPAWTTGTGHMPKEVDAAVLGMKVGDVSDPIETPFGYFVLRRIELPPKFAGSHILIQYKGATRAPETITRTKEEALALAKDLRAKAVADPSTFAALARQHSEEPSASQNGGYLGAWMKGSMVPVFDEAIEKLKIGEIGEPVESPYGFHVILRQDPDAPPPAAPAPEPVPGQQP
ncbi:MAG: hypothetical protein C4523_20540 [Myxococcales bacterium]|nr:MAG: hypothetical protein C4523_20540 [Myxococcales bacterium]